ncbi:hypothetical protein Tco_1044292 [Tanacetum coccineum]|uniref:Uncharacterized protein n=1 Tax=Tanacetum coccineum TaxID=301880 RepID=A0ABQ5GPH2_9ASTR
MSLVHIGWLSGERCGGKGVRGGSVSMISGIGGGWFVIRSMDTNIGRGDVLVVLGGCAGAGSGIVSGGGMVFKVVSSLDGEMLGGAKGVVGGDS